MILLVEDDENDVVLLCHEIRIAKLQNPIRVCGDGEAAIRYLQGDGEFADRTKFPLPVLIILDLKLPLRSGAEVLAWIEGHSELHFIPVIAVTAQNDPKQLAQISHLGASGIFNKPVRAATLLNGLRQLNKFKWKKTPGGEILEIQSGGQEQTE
jgi:CheY-like chemotaxis protein